MKITYIFQHTLRGPVVLKRGGNPVAINVFRWVERIPVETALGPAGWSIHFLVFCNAVMSDFLHQSRQGVFAIGWHQGLFVEFTPRITTYRLWLYPTIKGEKGTIK